MPSNEEKTEEPTPKKKQEAREEGQVASSKELNTAFTLLFSFVVLYFWMAHIIKEIIRFMTKVLVQYFDMQLSIYNFHTLLIEVMLFILKLIFPIMLVVTFVGVFITYLQIGPLFSTKVLKPKFSKLNPIQGFKQLFSKRSLVELVKSLLKITIVGSIAYLTIKESSNKFVLLMTSGIKNTLNLIGVTSYSLAMKISAVFIVLGIADLFYQKWEHKENLKMTKHEVKEERKHSEGSPEVKSQRKKKKQEMAMSRMMQEIPDASVVVTNPTHIAVAIKFDMDGMEVPIVVAKGQGEVAQRIKEIAREHEVEIVEEKPLARALYKLVDIGGEIPPDLYQAVAEILAYVYQLDNERRL